VAVAAAAAAPSGDSRRLSKSVWWWRKPTQLGAAGHARAAEKGQGMSEGLLWRGAGDGATARFDVGSEGGLC